MSAFLYVIAAALFLGALVAVIAPDVLNRGTFLEISKGKATRKTTGGTLFAAALAFLTFGALFQVSNEPSSPRLAAGSLTDPTPRVAPTQIQQAPSAPTPAAQEPKKPKTNNPAPVAKETETAPVTPTEPTPTPTPAPTAQDERSATLAVLKANASAKWGTDYRMVQFEYNKQVQAYDWVMSQSKYPEIMARAKREWGQDYSMVKYEYEGQVTAYEWIVVQTAYPDIMTSAKQKWSDDWKMVKYEYEKQVSAYQSL